MTKDILYPFETLFQYGIYNYRVYTTVISDFLTRTNNFNASNDRNDFISRYQGKLISTHTRANLLQNHYRLNEYITFQYEREIGTNVIERFLIDFPKENNGLTAWYSALDKSIEYERVNEPNRTFLTKMKPTPNPNVHLEGTGGNTAILNVFKERRRNYDHQGIGQVKLAIQDISPTRMAIGLTISNVFKRISEAQDLLVKHIAAQYTQGGVNVSAKHFNDTIVISFQAPDLISNSDRYHGILNYKAPYQDPYAQGPSQAEINTVESWKKKLIDQILSDCQFLDKRVLGNCIDSGLLAIRYMIGNNKICTIKLI